MEDTCGYLIGVFRVHRWVTVIVVALLLAWPVGAAPSPLPHSAPSSEQLRQFLQTVVARVDVEMPGRRGVCTGWVGWSDSSRSAVYTAGHCAQSDARYRVTIGTDHTYATASTKWEKVDLLALWIPQGHLPTLGAWKPLPGTPFQAMYMLTDHASSMRLVEVDIPRIYWEIRFRNIPGAVALPLSSYPGTSGSPIIDRADGVLLGMVLGYLDEHPEIAAVVPSQLIYDALVFGPGR